MEHPLRAYRSEKQLTLDALAKILGVSIATVSRMENGKQAITAEMAVEIERATNGEIERASLRSDLWSSDAGAAA